VFDLFPCLQSALEMVKVTYWYWICWWNCKVATWIWSPISRFW